jgi:hypothetical protein
MPTPERNPLDGAALVKLTGVLQGKEDDPHFRFIYRGVLKDLGLTDAEVDRHIDAHRDRLHAILVERGVAK